MGGYGIVGQVINVPVDVNNMITPPRQLDDDYTRSFNVHLKRNLIHKSMYLQGCIKKATVKRWLEQLVEFMKDTFELDVLSDLSQGTRSNSCIDMVFGRNVDNLSCTN
jgi:hypothetical protein